VLGFQATTTLDEMLAEVIPWVTQDVDNKKNLETAGQVAKSDGY